MGKRSPTTKDVALLRQLYKADQLRLAPEFQRNSVWPRPAKAYLIDTILNDRPMPLFFFQRGRSAQTGLPVYSVVDGQQRLRAIFEYLDDRFQLAKGDSSYSRRRFSELSKKSQEQILNYDISVEELSAYSDKAIQDVFIRMNKYVVKLSPQELRHAKEGGVFFDFVEELGKWDFWKEQRVFTPTQIKRMRPVEFSAELAILLIEGPQDKKAAIDLYYGEYSGGFPAGNAVKKRLRGYVDWIVDNVEGFANTRFRKPVDLYSLIGALDEVTSTGKTLTRLAGAAISVALNQFHENARTASPSEVVTDYLVAASRQTDNIKPRLTRMEIMVDLLRSP